LVLSRGGGKRMFPSEMVILMDIARNKDSGKQLMNQPMDVINEYICYLCDSLVSRGYIKRNKTRGYQLTSMGREILRVQGKNETGVKETKNQSNWGRISSGVG
jgi:predicted transcriptional regulator